MNPALYYEGKHCGLCGNKTRLRSDHHLTCRKKHKVYQKGFIGILFRERKRAADRRYKLRKQGVDI